MGGQYSAKRKDQIMHKVKYVELNFPLEELIGPESALHLVSLKNKGTNVLRCWRARVCTGVFVCLLLFNKSTNEDILSLSC